MSMIFRKTVQISSNSAWKQV